ncbi:MAG: ankyrin repeat domain-containing protein [Oligoflexia bacterium]|nr:ankyrin repeat domain-containing protein [Oligoflexia bacterium]
MITSIIYLDSDAYRKLVRINPGNHSQNIIPGFFMGVPEYLKNSGILKVDGKRFVSRRVGRGFLFGWNDTRFWKDPFDPVTTDNEWKPHTDQVFETPLPELLQSHLSDVTEVNTEEYLEHYGFATGSSRSECAKNYIDNLMKNVYFYDAGIFDFNPDTGAFTAYVDKDLREQTVDSLETETAYTGVIALDYHDAEIFMKKDDFNTGITFCTINCYNSDTDQQKRNLTAFEKITPIMNRIFDPEKSCLEILSKQVTDSYLLKVKVHSVMDARDKDGKTLLHKAAIYCNLVEMEKAFSRGAPVDILDAYGKTPLKYAADLGCYEGVKLLVEKGDADVCQFKAKDIRRYISKTYYPQKRGFFVLLNKQVTPDYEARQQVGIYLNARIVKSCINLSR